MKKKPIEEIKVLEVQIKKKDAKKAVEEIMKISLDMMEDIEEIDSLFENLSFNEDNEIKAKYFNYTSPLFEAIEQIENHLEVLLRAFNIKELILDDGAILSLDYLDDEN